jgi:hypothetical protein
MEPPLLKIQALVLTLALSGVAAPLLVAPALADPAHAIHHTVRGTGHDIAKTGRATGHAIANMGRESGHAVATTGRHIGRGVHHVFHPRHHHHYHR